MACDRPEYPEVRGELLLCSPQQENENKLSHIHSHTHTHTHRRLSQHSGNAEFGSVFQTGEFAATEELATNEPLSSVKTWLKYAHTRTRTHTRQNLYQRTDDERV